MQRIAQRDREAATTLFDRYADEIFGYLLRRTDRVAAEDVLQEVFARALCSASTYRGLGSVRSWLYGIARNAVLELKRDRIEVRSRLDLVEQAPGPESLAIRGQEQNRLLWALEQLPDDQAIVLELHRVDGLSHAEIGRLLGIRPAASRKRLERASHVLESAFGGLVGARSPDHSRFESWQRSLRLRVLPGTRGS